MRSIHYSVSVMVVSTAAVVSLALVGMSRSLGQAAAQQQASCEGNGADVNANLLATRATGEDAGAAKSAIAQLRAMGPVGLKALLDQNADLVARHRAGIANANAAQASEWGRVSAAIDAVAAQKDAYTSGLYWYTDLDEAKAAAKASGKPILSLRLLGTLDSEYSCANSRFFRTALYANKEISKALADKFVLHWRSVRPVPKITIDFGDGRVVERTITGNSIHYVLDAHGNVVDGIPGLYGPKAFLLRLNEAEAIARQVESMDEGHRAIALREWNASQAAKDQNAWQADLQRVTPVLVQAVGTDVMTNTAYPPQVAQAAKANPAANPPAALVAGRRAVGKGVVELPMVRALALRVPTPAQLETGNADALWSKIADLHADDARLDGGSTALMAAKDPNALDAGRLAMAKSKVETPMVRLVRNFERSIAEDSVRNEYTFHWQIHQWLSQGSTSDGKSIAGVDRLNEEVYAQLFLTPDSDPWLGLVPRDTYTALPDEGICKK